MSIEATAEVIRRSGFHDVQITPLESIYALDEKYGVAPGHRVQMKYAITAVRG